MPQARSTHARTHPRAHHATRTTPRSPPSLHPGVVEELRGRLDRFMGGSSTSGSNEADARKGGSVGGSGSGAGASGSGSGHHRSPRGSVVAEGEQMARELHSLNVGACCALWRGAAVVRAAVLGL